MKLLKYILPGILLLMISSTAVKSQQTWLGTGASVDLTPRISAKLKIQSRFVHEDGFDLYGNLSQVGLKYKITKGIGLGTTYRYLSSHTQYGEQISDADDKQRYTVDFLFKLPENRMNSRFKNRLRFQHSIKEDGENEMLVRNRITYEMSFGKGTKLGVSDEIFMEVREFEFEMNRISFELESKIASKISLETFFHIEKEFDHNEKSVAIIGAMLHFQL